MSDNNHQNSKQSQKDLREIQLKRDSGNTFGALNKDPCRTEREMSIQCLEFSRLGEFEVDCKDYFDNFKKCKKFWNEVQEYRVRTLMKSRNDYPVEEEYMRWKQQLPEWIKTGKLSSPEDSNEGK